MGKKTERLISLIIHLMKDGPLSLEEIASRIPDYGKSPSVEALRKKFQRDRNELRKSGIEITHVDNHLYKLDFMYVPFRKRSLMESEKNLLAEIFAEMLSFDCVFDADALRSAIYKVALSLGILPRVIEKEPSFRFLLNVTPEERELFNLLRKALNERCVVTFDYRPFDAESYSMYKVQPIFLCLKNGEWYLMAISRGKVRFFKLKRMKNLKVTEEKVGELKKDMEVFVEELRRKPWEYHSDEEYEILVKCPQPLKSLMERKFGAKAVESRDGFCYLKFKVTSKRRFFMEFSPYLSIVEIVEPEIIRKELAQNLKNIIRAFENGN